MAARLNPRHQTMVRDKIRASQLVNRLQDYVDGKIKLDPAQVQAAAVLLRKCIPDLSASEIKGEVAVGSITISK